jgi:hypothetical protein
MDFYAIMLSMAQCSTASNALYERIRSRPEIQDMVKFAPNKSDVHTFRIEFIRPEGCVHGIYGLSIAYPPDAMGNRGSKYGEGFPSTIETAILGKIPQNSDIFNAKLIYDENCGYYDVRRFDDDDIEGLVEEIVRISDYLSSSLVEDEHQEDDQSDQVLEEDI